MQHFHINARLGFGGFVLAIKQTRRTLEQLIASLLDLVGMHIELLGKLTHGLLTANSGKRDFRFEG